MENSTCISAIEEVLVSEDSLNPNYISVFSVWEVLKQMAAEEAMYREERNKDINRELKKINRKYHACLEKFEISRGAICLTLYVPQEKKLYFTKISDELILCKHHKYDREEEKKWLKVVGDDVETYYDYVRNIRRIFSQSISNIDLVNFGYKCSIYGFDVILHGEDEGISKVMIKASPRNGKFCCEPKSHYLYQKLCDHEDEFAKKLFVQIMDCPGWMQKHLHEIRDKQIAKKKEEIRLMEEKEERRQERRELWEEIKTFLIRKN